ncbi:MAG: hypothetical protein AAFR41_12210 [Pseudomonadota bacterium]
MMETMISWVSEPTTQWSVLAFVALVFTAEAIRTSRHALWGDFFDEDIEEDY